jgi:hypothetical protein
MSAKRRSSVARQGSWLDVDLEGTPARVAGLIMRGVIGYVGRRAGIGRWATPDPVIVDSFRFSKH